VRAERCTEAGRNALLDPKASANTRVENCIFNRPERKEVESSKVQRVSEIRASLSQRPLEQDWKKRQADAGLTLALLQDQVMTKTQVLA
jgi:cell fate (sporulation/competence/biofilm development) regulator YmcA (YheA/YmcA/DUF963 family)